MNEMTLARKIRIAVILSLMSFLLTMCGIELWLRAFHPELRPFTQPDDLLGYSFIPGAYYDFLAIEQCPGWRTTGYVNSHGLIDDEHTDEHPDNTFRILALGDSQTEGLQVERQYRWTDQLETQLNTEGKSLNYEIINAGRSGMGTALEYLYYTERGSKYQSDLVILVFTYNDLMDNSFQLYADVRPYFVLRDNELVLDTSFRESSEYRTLMQSEWARQNFLLVSFLRSRLSSIRQQLALNNTQPQVGGDLAATPQPETQDTANAYRDAVDVTVRLLVQLKETVEADHAQFVLVVATLYSDDNILNAFHTLYPELRDVTTNDEALTRIAEAKGITTLNIMPLINQYEEEHSGTGGCKENGYIGHWNQDGHRLVAQWIGDFLNEKQLLPK